MGVASLFGSVVLSDAILKIVIHYPLVVVATSNTFVATPLHVPHPSQRGGCIACPSSACVPSPCPPTDPSPTAIQHCLSVPASVVLPDARAPPTARLCLPFARHCVCVRPVCPSYVYVSVAPPCQYPRLAPLALASLRGCPPPLRVARTKQDPDTRARTRGELGGGCGGVKERRGATEKSWDTALGRLAGGGRFSAG
jgi:hypothetical protein